MKHSILALSLLVNLSMSAMTQLPELEEIAENAIVHATVGQRLEFDAFKAGYGLEPFCLPPESYDLKVLQFLESVRHSVSGNWENEWVLVKFQPLQAGKVDLKLQFKSKRPGWENEILGSKALTIIVRDKK